MPGSATDGRYEGCDSVVATVEKSVSLLRPMLSQPQATDASEVAPIKSREVPAERDGG